MSQEFLTRLLSTAENRARSEPGTNCMICLEEYNTLNTSTGIVEQEIRLPCGHGLGSSCIVTWLRDNNSCPACRATFFPRQTRPYLEHGVMDAGRVTRPPVLAAMTQAEPTASAAPVPAPVRRMVPPVNTTTVPAPVRRAVPLATAAPVPDSMYGVVLREMKTLVGEFALMCAIDYITPTLLASGALFMTTYVPGFEGFVERIKGSASAGPAVQAPRCLEWQDCSFLTPRSD